MVTQPTQKEPIAIIGIGCRFPGANNPQAFWELLRSGRDAIREVPPERWDIDTLYDPDPLQPGKMMSRWGGFIEQIDQFDWRTWRLLPKEVRQMDPQQRLLLEIAWETLEDAGVPLEQIAGTHTGVFVGIGWSDYLRLLLRNWSQIDGYSATGNASSFAASRLSYLFDLNGPSMSLDTGCTSSLTAIHLACQSLWAGETKLALAGGVNLLLSPDSTIMVSQAGLLSADGHCKTLDEHANGFVRGEGAGMLLLKPLSQVAPTDRVYALIRAVALNHNGHNEWMIAASQEAQEALLREVYSSAGVDPTDIGYVELHGTGFLRGDAIEADTLGSVLGSSSQREFPCMIGSVKTNIGHLEAASGIASVIKVALALHHREIPPTLHMTKINPDIHLQKFHLAVPQRCTPWSNDDEALLAGVTALALNGSNAHAILASHPSFHQEQKIADKQQTLRLFPLSARSEEALRAQATVMRDFLRGCTDTDNVWGDICYTASVRRTHHAHRLSVSGRSPLEAATLLDALLRHPFSVLSDIDNGQINNAETLLSTLKDAKEKDHRLLEALGVLYRRGEVIHWSELYAEGEYTCISLPTYQWQRERLWPAWLDRQVISTPPEKILMADHVQYMPQTGPVQEITDLPIEQALVMLWADVLGLEHVQAHDSFFALGGHSLLALQLITRIRAMLQVDISLTQLLQNPTPVDCAAYITQLKANAAVTTQTISSFPVVLPDVGSRYLPFPITDVQQVYWVGRSAAFELGNVGNHAYIEVAADGLNVQRLDYALQRLIQRHEMLRATLLPDGSQKILQEVPAFQSHIVDMRLLVLQAANAQLKQIRQVMDHQILPVDRWPTFEILVVYLDGEHIRVHLSVESLFFDAWSMNLLLQEFKHFYYEPERELPPLELSFRDYVLAEQNLHTTEEYERARVYWQQRLSSLPTAPELPLVSRQTDGDQPHFEHLGSRLEKDSWQRLKTRAAQAGLTPSSILLAAFAEVLATWSKTSRFGINLSLFNRHPMHAQVNDVVGDFTSLIVLAVNYSRPSTFEERARCLQTQLWQDLDHSQYSGIQVLRELARQRGGVMNAVMPVVFTSLLIQDTASLYPSPWQETIYCVTQTPQVWLDHQVLETAGELVFHWQFVEALFPPGLIQEMFTAYCCLLQDLSQTTERWHEEHLRLLPSAHLTRRAQVNATDAPITEELLHTLFVKQVYQRPQQEAVVAAGRILTYQQLYRQSMHLGYMLRQAGAQTGQLIAIVLEKGWEQVVAVLGILFSGAAYLPIDPGLPDERLCYLLEHGQVQIVLTQSGVMDRIAWPQYLQLFCIDTLEMLREDLLPLPVFQRPEDLAYVIYTSGSTGLPKGVMIDHCGAVNTILDINQRFNVCEDDRVLALSALNFDLSVYDLFGLLAAGGTIVIPAEGTMRNPAVWLELLMRERVTVWNSVPALFQMLIEFTEADADLLHGVCLRLVLLSGDWIPVSLPDRARTLLPAIDLISLGGATEASIWSILYPIKVVDPAWKSIPYGTPMLNQRFAVLNEALEPCPVWVPGTLYIGGIGLALGYWRDDVKTNASFFLHPRTGERLYCTGDLGRYLPDGTIEFLGREDFQVKVQGHRIELGEIEETLLLHPSVKAAVTIAATEPRGAKRLVSYVVLQPGIESPAPTVSYTVEQLRGQSSGGHASSAASHGKDDLFRRLELQYGQRNIRQNEDKPVIKLSHPVQDSALLAKYRERMSYRTFLQDVISLSRLERFLSVLALMEIDGLPKYRYPSAGGIYPVQVYLAVKSGRIEGLAEGVYYYHPQHHQLVVLSAYEVDMRHIHAEINQSIYEDSAFTLFLVAQMQGIEEQYGDAAKDFCLLEAGYISQLLMAEAPLHQIGLCPIGGLNFAAIRAMFPLEESHMFVHALVGGSVDPTVATGWSFLPGQSHAERAPSAQDVVPDSRAAEKTVTTTLRQFLQEKLPEYMIPSIILVLDTLPLTTNGKVDRNNLPAPAMMESISEGTFVTPQSELQKNIGAIWQEMLPHARIGLHDNFFDLGGNSLLMVRAYTRLRKIIWQDLSIIEMFFHYPTIHSLTEFLTKSQPLQASAAVQERTATSLSQKTNGQQRDARRQHRMEERNRV